MCKCHKSPCKFSILVNVFYFTQVVYCMETIFSNFSLDSKQEICHQIRLRGDNDLFFPGRKKRTINHPFEFVSVHFSCKMMHSWDA